MKYIIYANFNLFLKYENILPYSKCREISDTLKNLVYAPFSACLHVTFFLKSLILIFLLSSLVEWQKKLIKHPYFLFDWQKCMFGISVTLRELTSNVNGRNFLRLECNGMNSGFEPITDTGDHASINGNASVKRQQLLLPQRVNIVTGYFFPLSQ